MGPRQHRFVFTLVSSAALLGGLALVGTAIAGDLEPPAGPVAPTFKTLTEIEPRTQVSDLNTPGDAGSVFRIEESGSYYLTGNLDVPADTIGIEVDAPGVSLDLNGFTIASTGGGSGSVGLVATSAANEVSVRNGVLRDLGAGINIDAGAENAVLTDLRVRNIGGVGITSATKTTIRNCTIQVCADSGIDVGNESAVTGTSVSATQNNGIRVNAGIVRNCVVVDVNGFGIRGTSLIEQSSVNNCTDGIGGASVVRDCRVTNITNIGVTSAGMVTGTVVVNARDGIRADPNSFVAQNSVRDCTRQGISLVTNPGVGDNARIEANNISRCTVGIGTADGGLDADDPTNFLVIRNSVRETPAGGVAYEITGPGVAPIVSDISATTLPNPLANFEF